MDVTVIRDIQGLEEQRQTLERVGWSQLDADLDVYLTYLDAIGSRHPYALILQCDGTVAAAALARLQETELTARLGYRFAYRPRLRTIYVVHGGIVAHDDVMAKALVEEMRRALARGEADATTIPSLEIGSPLHRACSAGSPFARGLFEYRRKRRLALIPATIDEFLGRRSRNTRHTVKRYRRRFEAKVPNWSVRTFSHPNELKQLVADLEVVARETWQRAVGGGFVATPEELAVYRAAMQKEAFRAWLLYDAETPVAFWLGWRYGTRFAARFTGYVPSLADARPGLFLFMRMIEDLCRDPTVDELDFGAGDSQLKQSFTDLEWTETDVVLFASRSRPMTIGVVRSAINGLALAARAGVTRFETVDRARRSLRNRAAQSG